jgi:hypothetical protein
VNGRSRFALAAFLAVFFAAAPLFAAPPEPAPSPLTITTKLAPEPSHVGDLLELEVTVALPAGYTANLPSKLDLAPLEVVSVEESPIESTGQGSRKVFRIAVQQFGLGEITVPDFALTWVDPAGNVETATVPGRTFVVEALTANEPDPQRKGEDAPISLDYPNEVAETIILSAIATLIVAALAVFAWLRLRRRVRVMPLPPPIPADEAALAALDDLEARREVMVEERRHVDFYLELTEIAKAYVEGRFSVEALERTTDELRRVLEAAPTSVAPADPRRLLRFLEDCDLVKFARFAPPEAEWQSALGFVRTLVLETRRPTVDPKDRARAERPTKGEPEGPSEAAP